MIEMASELDEDRLLAEIEQHLAREDPDLAARISALDEQSPTPRHRRPRTKTSVNGPCGPPSSWRPSRS
ncbi:DUF3040 domain-containing protein [Streptomyces sp. NPDC051310]|uniref:DUF3040 domain-containing protein n=1 Tax=Streptomyces sp. NPDC051310 TaxID=3365649 RepID=UPI00379E75E4